FVGGFASRFVGAALRVLDADFDGVALVGFAVGPASSSRGASAPTSSSSSSTSTRSRLSTSTAASAFDAFSVARCVGFAAVPYRRKITSCWPRRQKLLTQK